MLSWVHIASLALLVPCWLVVVARGLYLARHLLTFSSSHHADVLCWSSLKCIFDVLQCLLINKLKIVLGSMVIICTPWQSCMTIEESQMVKGQNVPLGLFNQSMSICVIIWEGQIVKGQIVWLGGLVNNVPALVCRPWGCSGEKHQFTATQTKSMQRAENRGDNNFIVGFPDWHESGFWLSLPGASGLGSPTTILRRISRPEELHFYNIFRG